MSRKALKKRIRRDKVDELYLALIQETSGKDAPSSDKDVRKTPEWIQQDYGEIFREELPPGIPRTRTVDHQIPLKSDMPPPFKGIFRLSQFELQELKKHAKSAS